MKDTKKGKDIRYKFKKLSIHNHYLLKKFHCGNEQIDDDLRSKVLNNPQMTTFLVINSDKPEDIICIYSLSCSGYVCNLYSKIYVYPAVEIKYFAISKEYQDIRFSDEIDDGCLSNMILYEIINDIMDFTDNYCGADKIILYSTPQAIEFYEKCGFQKFTEFMVKSEDLYLDGCVPMYMDL